MARSASKLSISVPADLANAVRRHVGSRGLSGFVAQALAHELEREQLGEFLSELDQSFGLVSRVALASARRSWPKR